MAPIPIPSARVSPAAVPAGRRGPGTVSRSVDFGGRHVEYALRVSPKARRLRMVIRASSGLEVVVPRGMPLRAHESFLREKSAWIIQTLDRLREASPGPEAPQLTDGGRLRFAGRDLTLSLRDGNHPGHYRAALYIYFEPVITVALAAALLGERLSAAAVIGALVIALSVLLFQYPQVLSAARRK